MAYLAQFRDRFGWHDVDDRTFEPLRVLPAAGATSAAPDGSPATTSTTATTPTPSTKETADV